MKNNRFKIFSTLLILLLVGFNSCDNKTEVLQESIVAGELGVKMDEKLSPYILDMMTSRDLSGLAIGVVKDDKIVYAKAFGYENVETKEPATVRSIFHVASVSKPFVATAIMQLVEQGKVNLDSLVIKYLPYFKLDGQQYENITIKQMLTHTSGMPDVVDYEWDKPIYSDDALERFVRSLSSVKMRDTPGKSYSYSNMAFSCLGDVIAKVSGMSFADYVKKNILDPSGMKESTFLKPAYLPENWATPHLRVFTNEVWSGYPYNRMHAPSGTLHSNVLEMCNWALTNLNYGMYKNERILDAASYEVLWKPWFETDEENHIGLSWFLDNINGEQTVEHSGGDTGFSANFVLLPEKSIGVVVLANSDDAPVVFLVRQILNIINGIELKKARIPITVPLGKELKANGLNAAVEMWYSLKKIGPEEYVFHESLLNSFGYRLLRLGRVSEAIKFFQLNVEEYPKSANVYDSYGDALLAKGDSTKALKNFKLAYELDPSFTFSKKKIEDIEGNTVPNKK